MRQGEEIRFAIDSLVEGDGFEPSVPRQRKPLVEAASFARDRNRERTSGANVTCSERGSAPIAAEVDPDRATAGAAF